MVNARTALLLVILLALSGCAGAARVSLRTGLPPLGPCADPGWAPEAPPPTASTRDSLVLVAIQEWARFGRQEVRFGVDGSVSVQRPGIIEVDVPERVRDYWRATGRPDLSGLDDVPWSATFVSWVAANAGVDRDRFCPDARHSIYVERLVDRARQAGAGFVPRRVGERPPAVGDIVCAEREGSGVSLDRLNRGAGHCDIVVELRPGEVHAIGGNVRDSVSRSVFPRDANGFLTPLPQRPFFAVLENRLP